MPWNGAVHSVIGCCVLVRDLASWKRNCNHLAALPHLLSRHSRLRLLLAYTEFRYISRNEFLEGVTTLVKAFKLKVRYHIITNAASLVLSF